MSGKRTRRNRGFNTIVFLLGVYLIILALYYGNGKKLFGYKMHNAVTNNMAPAIKKGDLVFVKLMDSDQLKKGDIVVMHLGTFDKLLPQRLAEVRDNPDGSRAFYTKGDNNVQTNGPAAADQIMGIVSARIPLVGYIISFVGSSTWRIPIWVASIITILKVRVEIRSRKKVLT